MATKKRPARRKRGVGRPSKAEEQKLAEALEPMNKKALGALEKGIKEGKEWAIKLYFSYYYGKPVTRVEASVDTNVVIDMSEWQ